MARKRAIGANGSNDSGKWLQSVRKISDQMAPITHRMAAITHRSGPVVQGYLAHEKSPPPRTQQQDHAQGPMGVLRGWVFLMGEVPL